MEAPTFIQDNSELLNIKYRLVKGKPSNSTASALLQNFQIAKQPLVAPHVGNQVTPPAWAKSESAFDKGEPNRFPTVFPVTQDF